MTQRASILGVKFTGSPELHRILTIDQDGKTIVDWFSYADVILDMRTGQCMKNRWYDASTTTGCSTLLSMFETCPLQSVKVDLTKKLVFTRIEL